MGQKIVGARTKISRGGQKSSRNGRKISRGDQKISGGGLKIQRGRVKNYSKNGQNKKRDKTFSTWKFEKKFKKKLMFFYGFFCE